MILLRIATGKPLVGRSYQKGAAVSVELREPAENLDILLRGLGEAQARIEYPVAYAAILSLAGKLLEIRVQHFDYVAVRLTERVHGARIAPLVHGHIAQAQPAHGREHLWVVLPRADVIHQEGAHAVVGAPHDFAAGGVNRKASGVVPCPQERLEPAPLLFHAHISGARAGGNGAHIDDVRAAVQNCHIVPARRPERVRGEVDYAHQLYHRAKITKYWYLCALC